MAPNSSQICRWKELSMTEPTGTLLIVDDEPNVIKSLRRLLIDSNHTIITAESGADGLKAFDGNEIDLVISDYRMPGMNGVEFLSEVRKKYPATIRIVLSGYADVAAVVEAINDGHVYKFISKPWNDQELLTTILRAFEQQQLQRENARLNDELQKRNEQLEKAARLLEQKVDERTCDLEVKNRALKTAHRILDRLPIGVLGVDADETIVYVNRLMTDFFKTGSCNLGMPAREVIDKQVMDNMMKTLDTGEIVHCQMSENRVGIVCAPLPERAGVVSLFSNLFMVTTGAVQINNADIGRTAKVADPEMESP